MRISVIIPSYKRSFHLKRCLTAVSSQKRPADEVLVVAREGDEETLDVVSAFRHNVDTLRIVGVAESGVIAALNSGLDKAKGDLLVFTDDDSEAQADWLERIHASFSDEAIGAVGGRDWLQLPHEPAKFRPSEVVHVGALSWYGKQYGNHHCPLRGHTKKVMFLKGVNMALRRSALGSYRVDTCLHGSGAQVGWEIDLCLRIRNSGFDVVFDDRILVKHYCAPRLAGDCRDDLTGPVLPDLCFNNHYLIGKHFGLRRSLAHFCNSILLGSRHMPGLVASVKWTVKGDRRVWRRLWQIAVIALAGFRAGRHARTGARQSGIDLQATQPAA
jgi:glycosyltransferase involved in cell wall biosynthesis